MLRSLNPQTSMRPTEGRKTKFKKETPHPHQRSEGLTHRKNGATRYLIRYPSFTAIMEEMRDLNPFNRKVGK